MTHDSSPSSPAWVVNIQASPETVTRLEQLPQFEALPKATRTKARKGEPYRFPLDLVIEPTS